MKALNVPNVFCSDTRANLNYLDALSKFHMQRNGTNLNRFPSVDKRPLDLYKLKRFVEEKGGFELVCRQKRWAEIGRDLGYSGKIMSSLSTSLKNSYQKWLQPYEEWLRYNKPGILQQQDLENGGPYTPSPAATPAKSHQQTPNLGPPSPAIRASSALNAALQESIPPMNSPAPPSESQPRPPPIAKGFTPVNPGGGGFTAVNAPQPVPMAQPLPPPPSHSTSFSAINNHNGFYRPETAQSTPQRSEMSPLTSVENTPEISHGAPMNFGFASSINGNGYGYNSMKRGLSSDLGDESGASGDADASGRMNKRVKHGK